MTGQTPLLEAKNLQCERDDRILFENLSFSVDPGDVVQIEGPNGAGKTTLLKLLCGLAPLRQGELFWRGERMSQARPQFLSSLLYLGHKTGVKELLTPLENLRAWCAQREDVNEERMMAALETVGLAGYEYSPCNSLSAGQQRRAALARLHVSSAPLWVLDEAFTAIDKKGVAQLEALLREKANIGGAVILTTHHSLHLSGEVRRIQLGAAS
ncbi:cytochrome c biogenesis heme-transporting ATPase CcmA [Hahella sp. CR1]|uniref:cytochrome c biogenesis heme-transporting ATPase CcmA n=1 Tax=Hahella sp. CR1 TaxID=2992807 RepID=UPI002441CFA0|nr:cytochrome c biogenesis heme-transporting ATPase CcmA [Hahella sp. CR1]MDG9668132.1 cytochrome c biogenesis heme-transporting ATPase CcmA [Hahella sp. CR1]